MVKGLKALWTLCAITATGAGHVMAQNVVRTHDGGLANDLFGSAVSAGGDIDDDGVADYMVGAAEDGAIFQEREGYLSVFSGATGNLIRTHDGSDVAERFGTAATRVGDVNPGVDDNDDYAVGAHYFTPPLGSVNGKVFMYSGADGSLLWSVEGPDDEDELGFSLDGGYDVNGDGIPDVIAGAPRSDAGASSAGYAVVLSGADGAELYRKDGSVGNGRLGLAVCLLGDLNPGVDTRADFAVGSMNTGVQVYSGADGSLMYALTGIASTDLYGSSLTRLGDVTGDGIPELVIGASQGNFLFQGPGYVEVRNGATGALVYRKTGLVVGDNFGARVEWVGDYDADGFDDYMVASIPSDGITATYVEIFSGPSGNLLTTISGPLADRLGEELAGVGDADNDGKVEFLLGAETASANGFHSGQAVLYESPNQVQTGCVGSTSAFCNSLVNSTGFTATLALIGSTSVADNDFVLVSNRLPQNQPGVFYYGNGMLEMPFGNGIRCVGGGAIRRLGPVNTGPIGLAATSVDLSAIPAGPLQILGDSTWYFQYWYRDPAGGGVNFSNGLRVDFCD
jgi:FG-GAP repeat protein